MDNLDELYANDKLEPRKHLSHLLKANRISRPDEWSMDEYSCKALELEKKLEEAETENQRLTNRVIGLSERVHQLKCEEQRI